MLIVTGDLTARDSDKEHLDFVGWLSKQKYEKKIWIGGNHDNFLQNTKFIPIIDIGLEYLCDSGTEFEGFKIWGSPWTPWFKQVNPRCKAFMKRDEELFETWGKIPHDTDILITHGPAYGILDGIPIEDGTLYHAGSHSLYNWIKYVERPRLHIFSHIHEAYGIEEHFPTYNDKMMKSINCSHVNERYEPVNKPIRLIL